MSESKEQAVDGRKGENPKWLREGVQGGVYGQAPPGTGPIIPPKGGSGTAKPKGDAPPKK